jgi:hypothetical protein
MPAILSIFSSVLSTLFGIHTNDTERLETARKEITTPKDNDSNYTQMVRYEFTMELLQNTDKAIQANQLDKAYEYIQEADRISGYMGRVKELYLETCKLIIVEDILKDAITDCKRKDLNKINIL